jgi:hypothetical protein
MARIQAVFFVRLLTTSRMPSAHTDNYMSNATNFNIKIDYRQMLSAIEGL